MKDQFYPCNSSEGEQSKSILDGKTSNTKVKTKRNDDTPLEDTRAALNIMQIKTMEIESQTRPPEFAGREMQILSNPTNIRIKVNNRLSPQESNKK